MVLFCKYRHRRLARRGSLSAGRGRPALPKRKTTFQTNTCPRRLAVGRTRASAPTYSLKRCGCHPISSLPQLFSTFKAAGSGTQPLGAEPARASFGVIVYDCFRFFRRGFLDFGFASARNDISFARFAGGRGRPPLPVLPKVSTGIADMPTAARYSLPRDPYDCALRAPLRMTGQGSVTLCFMVLFCKYRHRRLARRGSLSAGRGRPALPKRKTTFQTNTCPRRLAVGRTRASAPTYSLKRCGCHPISSLPQLFSTFKALRGLGHSRKAVSHRGRVFRVVVYYCFRFFRRGFLDFGFAYARNDNVDEMLAGGRVTPLPRSVESKYRHRRLARRGSLH